MAKKSKIYLIVKHERCFLGQARWRAEIIKRIYQDYEVERLTNHGFLKLLIKNNGKFRDYEDLTTSIRVKDKTTHSDIVLSNLANMIARHGLVNGKSFQDVATVITHLIANLYDMGYMDESNYHRVMCDRFRELAKTVTAEVDHGWEIKALKRAGLYEFCIS